MILPEAQYMISTVACGLQLQIITSYKKNASFPPFTSSLIFPFAIPLKGTLLGFIIVQVCLHRCNNTSSSFQAMSQHSPDTSCPRCPQDTTTLPITSHVSMQKSSRLFLTFAIPDPLLKLFPNSFSPSTPYRQSHETQFPHHVATLISLLCTPFLCQSYIY